MPEIINNDKPQYSSRRRKGTGFTNTQDIVEKNKQNKLGQTVVSNIGKTLDTTQKQVDNAFNKFKENADKNRLLWDDNRDETKQVTGLLNEISSGNVDENKDYKTLTERFRTANYKGPTELEINDSVYNNILNTKNLARQGNTDYGRRNLLKRTFANGNSYTQGQTRLDSMLLGKTAQSGLSDLDKRAYNVEKNIENAKKQAHSLAKKYTKDTSNFVNRYNQEVNKYQNQIKDDINYRLNNLYKYSTVDLLKKINQDTGKIDVGVLNNINPELTNTYGLDLNKYQSYQANKNNIATDLDAAKMGALYQMMGQEGNYFNTNAEDFGKYNEIQKQQLENELLTRKAEYERNLNDLTDYTNSLDRGNFKYADYGRGLVLSGAFGNTGDQVALANKLRNYNEEYNRDLQAIKNYSTDVNDLTNTSVEDLITKYNINPNLVENRDIDYNDQVMQSLRDYEIKGGRLNKKLSNYWKDIDKNLNNYLALKKILNNV